MEKFPKQSCFVEVLQMLLNRERFLSGQNLRYTFIYSLYYLCKTKICFDVYFIKLYIRPALRDFVTGADWLRGKWRGR